MRFAHRVIRTVNDLRVSAGNIFASPLASIFLRLEIASHLSAFKSLLRCAIRSVSFRRPTPTRTVPGLWLVVLTIGVGTGCVRVKPWERDILSKPTMTFDAEIHENTLDHTFYSAREGTAGGFEAGGGGCGCN